MPLYTYHTGFKKKKKIIPSAGQDAEQLKLSDIDGRMQNGTDTLENCLVVSHTVKHTLII